MLYLLVSPLTEFEEYWQLWSYNPVVDAWKNTGAKSNTRSWLLDPQLIITNNRIYLISWVILLDNHDSHVRPTFDVVEIVLVDGACTKLSTFFQRNEAVMKWKFQIHEMIRRPSKNSITLPGCPNITAFGFSKGIVLIGRTSGISMEIDLATRTWDALQGVEALPCKPGLGYVKPMNHILPSALWWQGENSF